MGEFVRAIDLIEPSSKSPERVNLSQGEVDEESIKLKEQIKRLKAKWINEKKILNDNLTDVRNKWEQEKQALIQSSDEKSVLILEKNDLAKEVNQLENSIKSLESMLKINQDESTQKIEQMEEDYSDNLEKMKKAYIKETQNLNKKYEENIEEHRQESMKRINNLRKLNPDKAAMADMDKYRNKYEDEVKNVDTLRNSLGTYHKEIRSLQVQLEDQMADKCQGGKMSEVLAGRRTGRNKN